MTVITERFAALRSQSRCALIPFLTAGDPDLITTEKALLALDQNGADIIELGVPYSDPLADGPVIQAAATRALRAGTSLDNVLEMVQRLSSKLQAPIVLFTYYNPILNRGIESFLDALVAAGVRGMVVPDLPLEEADQLLAASAAREIDLILLVAPTSSEERIEAIARQSQGFIYLVSVTGVTGMREAVQGRVQELLLKLRSVTDKPVGVGFGISGPEQAKQMQSWGADGVIVGSAFVKRLATPEGRDPVEAVGRFCGSLKAAIS